MKELNEHIKEISITSTLVEYPMNTVLTKLGLCWFGQSNVAHSRGVGGGRCNLIVLPRRDAGDPEIKVPAAETL